MAWIEVHQNLAQHPKLLNLAETLGESRCTVMGRLLLLWFWGLDVTRDGALRGVTCNNIATVMAWDGDATAFCESLHKMGWLDKTPDGTMVIHDWEEYVGKLMDRRESNRERQRKFRNQKRNRDITITSPLRNGATVPNPTVPNRYIPPIVPPTEKKQYGEFKNVLLTDRDYELLVGRLTEPAVKEWIEILSSGMAANPKKYKYDDHRAAILQWHRRDKSNGGNCNGANKPDNDPNSTEAIRASVGRPLH